ncbi:MAG: uroporphyrinogen decarboxylase family protein [Aggregatilineales bacterium]
MDKRERLERTIAGDSVDRPPVALWRYFPGDDQRSADFAHASLHFQLQYDWDFLKVTPASTYCVADHGSKDFRSASFSGDREISKFAVQKSLQWTELRPIEPSRGEYGKQLEALRLIGDGLHAEQTPFLATVFSPLAQAARFAGESTLTRHLRLRTDRVRTGLNAITESLLRFIEALKRIDIAGIYYVVEHADFDILSEEEYRIFGTPYDYKVFDALSPRWWLNIVQLKGNAPMFDLASAYPVHAINWDNLESTVDLATAKLAFPRALCTGLSAIPSLQDGTPTVVRDRARTAFEQMDKRRLILSAGDATTIATPISNYRAARDIVQLMQGGINT